MEEVKKSLKKGSGEIKKERKRANKHRSRSKERRRKKEKKDKSDDKHKRKEEKEMISNLEGKEIREKQSQLDRFREKEREKNRNKEDIEDKIEKKSEKEKKREKERENRKEGESERRKERGRREGRHKESRDRRKSDKHEEKYTGPSKSHTRIPRERKKQDSELEKWGGNSKSKHRGNNNNTQQKEEDSIFDIADDRDHSAQEKNEEGENQEEEKEEVNKEKPDFSPSGILAEETNTFNGVLLKFTEPEDAETPEHFWRIYQFKGEEQLQTLHLHRQRSYLFGRDRRIVDVPLDHLSCSLQHAVLQYRAYKTMDDEGNIYQSIKPYIMDLESTNKTFLNGDQIEPARYYELREKDLLKFAFSSREYVIMNAGKIESD